MNFLQLAQQVRQECGITGTGPTTVANQTGELKRVVDWTAQAYREICAEHNDWKFLRSKFSLNTVAGTEAYLPTVCVDVPIQQAIGNVAVGNFASWITDTFRIYKQSDGPGTRQFFWPIDYEYFRNLYELIVPAHTRPYRFAIRPWDLAILCAPIPDDIYVIEGEYWRSAPTLVADGDTPIFPERFHMAIVWLACRYYAGYEEDGGAYADFDSKYKPIHGDLEIDQRPRLRLAGPLA